MATTQTPTSLPERLAERVKAGAALAYADPVDVGGVTIVPVSVVGYGFGAGEGTDEAGAGGTGGGGGAWSVPVGAYVPSETGPRFQPNVIALLAVGIPFVWATGHALRKVLKALKR